MRRFLVINRNDTIIGEHDTLSQARVDRSQRPKFNGRNMNRIVDTRTGRTLVKAGDPSDASPAARHKVSTFWKRIADAGPKF